MEPPLMQISKKNIAITLALLFHVSGALGILFSPYKDWFVQNTPLNLCLMAGLLMFCQEEKNKNFWLFSIVCWCTGMVTEIIGVNTGLLFGNYAYGSVLGFKLMEVPLLIGLQWFVVVFCCGITLEHWHLWLQKKGFPSGPLARIWILSSKIIDAALLATFFDFIMEPVAVKLSFWNWANNEIPFLNYACWFGISALLLLLMQWMPFSKKNQFAPHLLLIQTLFFATLRLQL
jgi:bisanhydrobacterioruberin hydratase